MRRTASLTSWFTSDVFRKREPARDMRRVRTLWRSKPGSTALNAAKVRMSSAAPTNRTSASATSPTTSRARVFFWCRLAPERPPPLLRVAVRSARETSSAGMSPNKTPVASETRAVKATTRQSKATAAPCSPMRGMSPGFTASSARTPARPSGDQLARAAHSYAASLGFHAVIDNTCDDWSYNAAADYLLDRLRQLRRDHP